MAHRTMILTEAGAQVYRNRMLTAGTPVTLGANDARLFAKHGWAEEAKGRKRAAPAAPKAAPPASPASTTPTLAEARKLHKDKFGKLPGPRATVDDILAKIAAA